MTANNNSPDSKGIRTNVKQGALLGGTICFVSGIFFMFISLWSFIVYAPLFFAAFVLSIVAMAQRRVLGGLLLLLATAIIPPCLLVTIPALNSAQEEVTKLKKSQNPTSSLPTHDTKTIELLDQQHSKDVEEVTPLSKRQDSNDVRYEEGKDEFSTNTYHRVSLLTSDAAPATLFITVYSNATTEIQLATKNVIFPDDTTSDLSRMKLSVTYKFDNSDRTDKSFWLMNVMKYHNAWYQDDHVCFLDEAIRSDRLSIRLDKSGDVYRFNLAKAKIYLAKIKNELKK